MGRYSELHKESMSLFTAIGQSKFTQPIVTRGCLSTCGFVETGDVSQSLTFKAKVCTTFKGHACT